MKETDQAKSGDIQALSFPLEEKLKQHDIPYYYKRTQDYIESESEFIRCFELGMKISVEKLIGKIGKTVLNC